MLALPIFPGRLQPSIVGRSELNFRVRDGNGWTLALISTYFTFSEKKVCKENFNDTLFFLSVPSSCTLKTEQCDFRFRASGRLHKS